MTRTPDFRDDTPILYALGVSQAPLIGHGGEARVYALDDKRVVRILHPGATLAAAQDRTALLAEVSTGARHLPFATPEVEGLREFDSRVAMIERRLPGRPLSHHLAIATGTERELMIDAHLNATARIAEIELRRQFFGDLITPSPVRRADYRTYLRDRIAQTRRSAIALVEWIPDDIGDLLPDCGEGRLVHFDVFPGNVLLENGAVTAIIDFGPTAMIADPRLDLWSAVSYLEMQISPHATDADRARALNWLVRRGIGREYEAAKRWIAAYWCYALDDPNIMSWCREVLEPSEAG